MLPLLELEAIFFKRHNVTSGRVGSSLKRLDIRKGMTRSYPLALSTVDAPCNIIKEELKELFEFLVLALHM